MVWYSHLLKNFPQLVVIHTVRGFGVANKAEVDVFLELLAFLMTQFFFLMEPVRSFEQTAKEFLAGWYGSSILCVILLLV